MIAPISHLKINNWRLMLLPLLLFSTSRCHGTECRVNSDCSPTEALRCAAEDVYCLNGQCHQDCTEQCEAIRTDMNPCRESQLCAPRPDDSGVGYCTIMPIRCLNVNFCPVYQPQTGAEPDAEWSCEGGICTYPGFSYATN